MSFKKQLTKILITFTVIPMFIVGMLSLTVSVLMNESNISDAMLTLARTNGTSLNALIKSQQRELSLMASQYSVIEYLEAKGSGADDNEIIVEILNRFLFDWIDTESAYEYALITDFSGTVVKGYTDAIVGHDLSGEDYFINAMSRHETYISNSIVSPVDGSRPAIAMSHRIDDSAGNPVGVLVLYIASDYFEDFVSSLSLGNDNYAFLTDSNGIAIYHPNKNLVGDTNVAFNLKDSLIGSNDGYEHKHGVFEARYDGETRMMYYYLLDETPWVLVFTQTSGDFHALRNIMLAVTIITVLLCVFVAIFASRKLSKRISDPINTLIQAFSQSYETGEYAACHIEGDGEFVELAENYNAMTAKINAYFSVLEDIAYHDAVTGVGNYAMLEHQLQKQLDSNASGGVISIDIDDFKSINDIYGRDFGNDVLIELARRLSQSFDLCARTGGDEFYLLKYGTHDEVVTSVRGLLASFGQPFILGEVVIELTPSIGVAYYPTHGQTVVSVTKNAEIAMYRAKAAGRNRFNFFDETMENSLIRHNQVALAVKNCIEQQSIFLVYQSEVDPFTNKIRAFETLMRINDSKLGFISPVEFIPIAESTGHIIRIGKWILETACRFAKSLREANVDFDVISVNVSAIQLFERSFVSDVVSVLEIVGLEPKYLQLEITESVLIRNMNATIRKLEELRELGISIALDDFGTLYSSLTYLTDLPIDVLKIDKSFIDDICNDRKRLTVTKTIINMSHEMHLKVVAEGIETVEQLEVLKELNCDLIQGYLFSKPIPTDDAKKLALAQ